MLARFSNLRPLAFILALVSATGCYDLGIDFGPRNAVLQSEVTPLRFEGQLGAHGVSEGELSAEGVFIGNGYLSLDLYATTDGSTMMMSLSLFEIESFEFGETYTISSASEDSRVDLLGCAGPFRGIWEVDEWSEEVEVVLHETADGFELEFTAWFDSGRQSGRVAVVY